jgi:hypothetical protein
MSVTRWCAVVAGVLAAAGPAGAQGVPPVNPANPYFRPGAPAYTPPAAPGGFYPGYAGWGMPASAGALTGAASVMDAQGNYKINRQQAKLIAEQVKSAQMDNKRKSIELWKYEQNNTPSLEEMRLREIQAKLDRARNNPPLNEIWSGTALNSLLQDIQNLDAAGYRGPSVPVDQAMLRQVNVVAPNASGTTNNAGMLKNIGHFDWPLVLQDPAFDGDRKRLDKLLAQAVREAGSGMIPAQTLRDLNATYASMQSTLRGMITEVAPADHIVAKRYLNQVGQSINTLQSPDAGKYLSGQWAAQGSTVAELVKYMSDNGLEFAPVTIGNETAYTVLYRALVTYDTRTVQLVARGPN